MAANKTVVHRLLERAHSPDTASQIFADKVQYRPQLLRPTSPPPPPLDTAAGSAPDASETLRLPGHDGREARRRYRRRKQEHRRETRRSGKAQLRPKPLSARQRRALALYAVPGATQSYATFLPLHRLWLGYIREVLGPELRSTAWGTSSTPTGTGTASPAAAAAIKLTAADFHGAAVLVTRSACVGRVGLRGIVVRDTRFVLEVVTPDNSVKMVPKEGTFFRIAIPVAAAAAAADEAAAAAADRAGEVVYPTADGGGDGDDHPPPPSTLVVELLGSQFMHRAPDRANRKFKQHFYKEL